MSQQTIASNLKNRSITFIDKVDEYFNCSICLQVSDIPSRCSCFCSGVFCTGCIKDSFKKCKKNCCPLCNKSNVTSSIDVILKNQIMNFNVNCVNNEECSWTGKYCDLLESHLQNCEYETINCKNNGCLINFKRNELVNHELSCINRLCKCDHCNISVKYYLMKYHIEICPKYQLQCQCGLFLSRDTILEHKSKECPMEIIKCEIEGCNAHVARKNYQEHMNESSNFHIQLLQLEITKQKQLYQDFQMAHVQENSLLIDSNVNLTKNYDKLKYAIQAIQNCFNQCSILTFNMKWKIKNVNDKLKNASNCERRYESTRHCFGHNNGSDNLLWILAICEGNKKLGIYLFSNIHLNIGGTQITISKNGSPQKTVTFPDDSFTNQKGKGFQNFLDDIKSYIFQDSIEISVKLNVQQNNVAYIEL